MGRGKELFAEMVFRMRTDGATPARQAAALAVGVFIGCTPLFGLHLGICLVAARLFRLNVVTMYIGAQISHPIIAVPLYFSELQAGSLLRRGAFYALSMAEFRALPWHQFLLDLCLGSLVVGAALGVAFGFAALPVFRRTMRDPLRVRVADAASRRYLSAGVLAWEGARSRLKGDAVFTTLLERRLLPEDGLLVDLGCGRGHLLVLLAETEAMVRDAVWPPLWPAPPTRLRLLGVERKPKVAAAALEALGEDGEIVVADARVWPIPSCRVCAAIDLLRELRPAEAEALVARAAAALEPGGALLLREADAAGGWRFRLLAAWERIGSLRRGEWRLRRRPRPIAAWADVCRAAGLVVEGEPFYGDGPFARALIVARKPR